MPLPALPGEHTALTSLNSYGTLRQMPSGANIGNHLRQISRVQSSIGIDRLTQPHSALPRPLESSGTVGIAPLHPAGLGHREGLFCAPGDRLAFRLRHQRHDADSQIIRLWHIYRKETHAAVAQGQQEGRIAR